MRYFCLCLFTLFSTGLFAQQYDVTFKTLLEEMTDPAAHSKWTFPSYTCRQSSSYSRLSVTPSTAKEDGVFRPEEGRDWGQGWFENHDFANYYGEETVDGQTEYVLHRSEGPGCITRFWTAFMGGSDDIGGDIRVYLDGNETPVIDMNAKKLLGSNGLVGYPFSFYAPSKTENDTWRGNNLYLPIPYANGCKISYRPYKNDRGEASGDGLYYQINYRTYEQGTSVESFTDETMAKYARDIYDCSVKLTGPKALQKDEHKKISERILTSGGSAVLKVTGEQCITSLSLKLIACDISDALANTSILISFDGEQTVECPAGKFFGVGKRQISNNTFYVNAQPDGMMTAYWVMPFRKEATVSVVNNCSQPVGVELLMLTVRDSKWDPGRSMYFHASWCGTDSLDSSNKFDYNYVSIKGKGKYVADGLTVYNHFPDSTGINWWGEGDEKIFVDGESFPSHFGTGTEDYYSYAYCRPQPFSHPAISQPLGEGNKTPGLTQNNRYRLLDDIPFERSLDFYMEIWHPYYAPMDYSPATFWYAFKGCTWTHKNSY